MWFNFAFFSCLTRIIDGESIKSEANMAHRIIDSHQHYWSTAYDDYGWLTPALALLYRDFGPEDLAPHLAETGVDRTILVQAAPTVDETERLLLIAGQEPTVAGVVGWAPLDEPGVERTLMRLAGNRKLLAVRPMLQDIEDVNWITRGRVQAALGSLVTLRLAFDALVKPQHLPGLLATVEAHPDLRVVIDHGAKPDIAGGEFEPWATHMEALAGHDNVFCKLSGLLTEAGRNGDTETLQPYVRHLFACFGADRLMWGSDWPVLEQVSTYRSWHRMSHDLLKDAGKTELDRIFGGTAHEFYRLPN